jgi:hypothetical protein
MFLKIRLTLTQTQIIEFFLDSPEISDEIHDVVVADVRNQ